MILKNQSYANRTNTIPIPFGAKFSGDHADDLAILASKLLLRTAVSEERRDFGYFIPYSYEMWVKDYRNCGIASKVKKAARNSDVFEFNDRYSSDPTNGFPQSIRLSAPYRTGQTELYELPAKRKFASVHTSELDESSRILIRHFKNFWLPDECPVFDNPWQMFTWNSIASQCYYAHRCEYGRFHSNFTSFKHRTLLQSNSSLCALDVASCQMLILGAVAQRAFGRNSDLDRWLELCSLGKLYEHFADLLGTTRQNAKNGLIRCVFERSGVMTAMPVYIALEREFGALGAFLVWVKKEGYQRAAHLCQRLESEIMISKVALRLRSVPIITIHDEVIMEAASLERIQGAMLDEFRKHGMEPYFKVTELQ